MTMSANPSPIEVLKEGNPHLAGTIRETLADPQADHFSEGDAQLLKFHGTYQQTDRDTRKTGKRWIFMVRMRLPGGVANADQYLTLDRLSEQYGSSSLRITTRQGFQFHQVVKGNLRRLIHDVNEALVTTQSACGDVVRNVMAPPTPITNGIGSQVFAHAQHLSGALLPSTPTYHGIWIDGEPVTHAAPSAPPPPAADPLYGRTYLPRKFKVAFVIPPLNDIDIFSNDCGFIAIAEGDRLAGYNLAAGGGMGRSHNNPATFPRLGDVIGFLKPEQAEAVAKAIVTIHRDFGDRSNRRHARLKYVIDDRGVEWFRAELESRLGFALEPARPFQFTRQGDLLGWHRQYDGRWFFGLHVPDGRIIDAHGKQLKTALREIAQTIRPEFRCTPSENLLLVGLTDEERPEVDRIFAKCNVLTAKQGSPTRLASMSCVSLPTCGLALAESERVMPDLLGQIEKLLEEVGLANHELIVRLTGCPNGCARPYLAEVGVVGRSPGKYQLYLGGTFTGERLNRLYKDNVPFANLTEELRPLLVRYRQERREGERFGDWCARTLWVELNLPAR